MNLRELEARVKSNQHEGDEYFMPSDKVWNAIENDLDDKKDKPVIALIIGLMSLFIVVGLIGIKLGGHYISPQQSLTQTKSSEDNTKVNRSISSDSHVSTQISTNTQISQNNNRSIEKHTKVKSFATTESLTKRDQTAQSYSRKVDQGAIGSVYTNTPVKNDNNSAKSIAVNKKIASLHYLQKGAIHTTPRPELLAEIPLVQSIESRINISTPLLDMDPITIIPKAHHPWSIEWLSSITNTHFDITPKGELSTQFDLLGARSYSHQITAQYTWPSGWAIYGGISRDKINFDADYQISLDQQNFTTSNEGENLVTTFGARIPSLAGGLETAYQVTSNRSDIANTDISMNLAHNYKLINIPMGVSRILRQDHRWNISLRTGLIYSRRLLSIDTGVNALHTQHEGDQVDLISIAPSELTMQPFRIHNMSVSGGLMLDYRILNHISVGVQAIGSKPILGIYDDNFHNVNMLRYSLGAHVRYRL